MRPPENAWLRFLAPLDLTLLTVLPAGRSWPWVAQDGWQGRLQAPDHLGKSPTVLPFIPFRVAANLPDTPTADAFVVPGAAHPPNVTAIASAAHPCAGGSPVFPLLRFSVPATGGFEDGTK